MGGVLAALVLSAGGCKFIGVNDDGDGGAGQGGDGTGNTGNTGNPGGGGGIGDGGAGGSPNGSGGGGGAPVCESAEDCQQPAQECFTAICVEGECGVTTESIGVVCSIGFCDGIGQCVECIDEFDCGADQYCNLGFCESTTLRGPCGDNLCQLEPLDNACFNCVQAEGGSGGYCDAEWSDCLADGQSSSCTTCIEFFNGEGQSNLCFGTATIVQDLLNCLCTPGVCAN